jgi:hypothetical protein
MIINIDPFFLPLSKLKEKISKIFNIYFKWGFKCFPN